MEKTELIEFLKENLSLEISESKATFGGAEIEFSIKLGEEKISTDSFIIN